MRGIAALRSAGILDGIWTAAASVGSKVQALALLAAVGAAGGIEATGLTVLVTSTAILAVSLLDAGLTPQMGRLVASGSEVGRESLVRPLARRLLLHVPLGAVLFWLVVILGANPGSAGWWLAAQMSYAVGFHLSYSSTSLAYGQFRFRRGATVNAVVRLGTVPILVVGALAGLPAYGMVLVMAAGEVVIAAVQYVQSAGAVATPRSVSALRVRNTWRYGVGAIANTIMNRSDTTILAWTLTATGLGIYAVASQAENALVTIALVPAGALIVHVARAGKSANAQQKYRTTARVVCAIYAVLAVPLLLFPAEIVQLVLRVDIGDPLPLRICVVSGVFWVLGSVQMQHLTGLGEARSISRIWVATAVISILAMVALSASFGAVGAAMGAAVRDLAYAGFTSIAVRRQRLRDVDNSTVPMAPPLELRED